MTRHEKPAQPLANTSFQLPDGRSAHGYATGPADARAGVIVIQEWWGLVPHIADVADRFAALGYRALAPDLYQGKATVDADEASHLMGALDFGRAAQEIAAAAAHLRSTGCARVAIVGFCMGGALTVIAATQPGVDAYAAFYGFPPSGAANLDAIQIPGLIFFGEKETFFSITDAKAFAEKQSGRGIATEGARDAITIRDGMITGWGGSGIDLTTGGLSENALVERVSAIANVPLTLFFVGLVVALNGASYEETRAALGEWKARA